MTIVEIKARMYDLIIERDEIQFFANKEIESLHKQSAEIKQSAESRIKPLQDELNNLYNQLNTPNDKE